MESLIARAYSLVHVKHHSNALLIVIPHTEEAMAYIQENSLWEYAS